MSNTSLVVDASDGGYIITSLQPSPDLDEWAPETFADEPGQVAASGSVATVNTLATTDDERVLLSSILLTRPFTEQEISRRVDQGAHVVRFTLEARGPLVVMSNDLDEQHLLASDVRQPIDLNCCLIMVLEPDKLEPDDPLEIHHLRMWPADGTIHAEPWWR
jgi:hypothetical protein